MVKIGMIVDKRYKILREIGRGGTSCVYLAENIRLHNYWAIKEVYKTGVTGNGVKSNTLIAESSILTKLRHPGLPTIIDIVETPQSYLLVMEYVEGVSLDKVVREKGAQSEQNVVKWGQQLCDVLEYIHGQDPPIIYRDMKPANIMLRPDGNIVLIDFGMARKFKSNSRHDTSFYGTHGYAAPEQYDDRYQTDARTDIYGVGVTLYHLVTGRDPCLPPYKIESIRSVNPSLSVQLDQIIQKCVQLEPEQRYQTAHNLNQALKALPSVQSTSANLNHSSHQKNNKWLWLLLVIPIVLLVILIAVLASGSGSTSDFSLSPFPYQNEKWNENVTSYFEQQVFINEPDQREYYSFVPDRTGYYDIYSVSGEILPVIWISDADDNLVMEGNTSGEYTEFQLRCWLEEGSTYYVETTLYDLNPSYSAIGTYWIYIEYVE